MRVVFLTLLLALLFSCSLAPFFPKIFSNKQAKDAEELELDTIALTKEHLEGNRVNVVACSILLRHAYSLHHQTIAKGLVHGIKPTNTNQDINEKLYFANLENCITRISDEVATQIANSQHSTRYFDKIYNQFFITNEKTLKKFIKQGTVLSNNQQVIKSFIKSELEGEFGQMLHYFSKIKSHLAIQRERKEKTANDKHNELWEIALLLGCAALLIAGLLCCANNRKESYPVSRGRSTKVKSY